MLRLEDNGAILAMLNWNKMTCQYFNPIHGVREAMPTICVVRLTQQHFPASQTACSGLSIYLSMLMLIPY